MSKKLIYLLSFVLSLGVLQAVPAEAQPVEFEFGGVVTDMQSGLDPPWDQVDVNDQWSIVYTFDPTTTDSTPAPDRGDYYLTITSYTLTIGSVIDSNSNPSGVGHISVFNNRPPDWDQYEVSISGPGGQYDWFMQLDGPNTIWDTDELPLCGDIELSDFSTRDFRLTNRDPFGDGEINGSVDYHRCIPFEAYDPSPVDAATSVDPNVVLDWSPGAYAAEHNVYFGTDPNALVFVAIKPLGQESYDPLGDLELSTTYYWRIDEVNGVDVWEGDVWSFTTRGLLFGDVELNPLGQAQLAIVDSNLVVSNIGSSGEDGVECTKPGGLDEFMSVTVEFEDLNSAPVGTTVELTQKGTIGIGSEDTDQKLTALVVTKAASDEWMVTPDFTPVGVDSYQYQVENNGISGGVLPGGTRKFYMNMAGAPVSIGTGPHDVDPDDPPDIETRCGCNWRGMWWDPAWYRHLPTGDLWCRCPRPPFGEPHDWMWRDCCYPEPYWGIQCPEGTSIYVDPGGAQVIGNRVEVVALETPSTSALFGLDITAANATSITITDIRAAFRECKWIIPGDFDRNCRVDFKDFAMMANNWLEDATTWQP